MARLSADHLTVRVKRWPKRDLYIGISGWTYPPWRGVFYPKKLAHRLELEFASREFDSIEINGSFYSLQRPSSYQRWYTDTPPGFVFSVKGARFITHMKKLRDVETPLANFFASGVLCLQETGADPLAVPAEFRVEPKSVQRIFRSAAARHWSRSQTGAEA